MSRNAFKISILMAVLACRVAVSQAPDPVSIDTRVNPSRITIGDLVTYTVTVTHDPDVEIAMPGLGANLGGFEIRDYKAHEPVKTGGKIVTSTDYILSTFFTGEFIIPPMAVAYRFPGDTAVHVLSTEKMKIMVESLKPSEAGDIRDIKPPVEMPRNWWYTLRWPLAGTAVLALLLLVWWGYRRRKAGKGLLPVRETPARPPHEIAFEQLRALRESGLLAEGNVKEFHIRLSDILRNYLEGRYFIRALEMTTEETLDQLNSAAMNQEDFESTALVLERSDLVKFAKHRPPDAVSIETLDIAQRIVEHTAVIIEAPSPETGAPGTEDSGDAETAGQPVSGRNAAEPAQAPAEQEPDENKQP
ncbi:hypothetical protein JW906_03165 [bacterium]|nr:hypothetical protein [bacterium]